MKALALATAILMLCSTVADDIDGYDEDVSNYPPPIHLTIQGRVYLCFLTSATDLDLAELNDTNSATVCSNTWAECERARTLAQLEKKLWAGACEVRRKAGT